MPSTYRLRCRKCDVALEVVSEETGDSECQICRIPFDGDVLLSFLQHEITGTLSEPVFEIGSLPNGQPTARPRQDLLDDLRRNLSIVKTSDWKFRIARY